MSRTEVRAMLIILLAGAVLVLLFILGRGISPTDETVSAIIETKVRMRMYIQKNRDYPKALSELPKRDDYANRVVDAWGRQLKYSVDSEGIITLGSYGKDGVRGGDGLDSDIFRMYRTRGEDGSLTVDDPNWLAVSEVLPEPGNHK